jgi:hypothetical protein
MGGMEILLKIITLLFGLALAVAAVTSAVRTFVLPRSVPDPVVRLVFRGLRAVFDVAMLPARTYAQRDAVMAFFGPMGLLTLLPAWLLMLVVGYTGMYWAAGASSLYEAFKISGSSLLTLGIASSDSSWGVPALEFSEAMLGLILVALLIAYLPTIYSAFAKRESAVSLLEVRAGSPPSATELIERYQRIHGFERLHDLWAQWEVWFAEVEESHTSLAALVFFRSPKPERSWVTAAGAVLDAAALVNSALDIPHDLQADLTLRAGYLALRSVADVFGFTYDANPKSTDPISVSRAEFDAAWDHMAERNVPLKTDRDEAWRHYAGWRVNYDRVLVALAHLTLAPRAPWSSDRPRPFAAGRHAIALMEAKKKMKVKREAEPGD